MFGSKTSVVKAVEGVSFSLYNNEVLVIAGESGSGKTTIAKLILGAITPDSGKVIFQGTPKELLRSKTLTGDYLSGRKKVEVRGQQTKKSELKTFQLTHCTLSEL